MDGRSRSMGVLPAAAPFTSISAPAGRLITRILPRRGLRAILSDCCWPRPSLTVRSCDSYPARETTTRCERSGLTSTVAGEPPRKFPSTVMLAPGGWVCTLRTPDAGRKRIDGTIWGSPATMVSCSLCVAKPGLASESTRSPESNSTVAGVSPNTSPSARNSAPAGSLLTVISAQSGSNSAVNGSTTPPPLTTSGALNSL